jgi:hypothetical protein
MMSSILLVEGLDDVRRSPIAHLAKAGFTTPIDHLIVHHAGRRRAHLGEEMDRTLPPFIRKMSFRNEFLQTNEEFASLFAHAKFALIAYSPEWLQASGNLGVSILSGTPVLCSRFPYSDSLFERYGALGEQFEYNDLVSLRDAWERLAAWSEDRWTTFDAARRRLTEDVSSETVVARAIQALIRT